MKPIRFLPAAALLLLAALCGTAGCKIDPGADPVIVTAERTQSTAFDTINAFLVAEDQDRELYKTKFPQIHAFAEQTRRTAPSFFVQLHNAELAYKAAKNPTTESNLDSASQSVAALAGAARTYLLQLKKD